MTNGEEHIIEYRRRFHLLLSSLHYQWLLVTSSLVSIDHLAGEVGGNYMFEFLGSDNVHFEKDFWDFEDLEKVWFIRKVINDRYKDEKTRSIPPDYPPNFYNQVTKWALTYAGEAQPFEQAKTDDLVQLTLSQALVMIIAYLEAFFVDSIRLICKINPNVMKSKKKEVNLQDIIGAGSLEEVIELLIGIYIDDFNFKGNITDGIKVFRDQPFKLEIKYPQERLLTLDKAKELRHLIVHNDGRVDKRYLERMGSEQSRDLSIGQRIRLDIELIGNIWESANGLATQVYCDVMSKFLGENPEIMLFWEDRSFWSEKDWGKEYSD